MVACQAFVTTVLVEWTKAIVNLYFLFIKMKRNEKKLSDILRGEFWQYTETTRFGSVKDNSITH